jgi:hypothetical protein
MSTINFAVVKMAHQTWRLKLRAYLNGTEEIDPKSLVSHRDCSLGKWIYSTEAAEFTHSRDFLELESKHKVMHQMVKEVVELKRMGRCKEAAQELAKVREFADMVVALITKLEEKVNGNVSV